MDLPTVYVSGDNASIRTVAEIARRISGIDAAILHAGAARVRTKFRDRALSLDSIRAAAAAAILDPALVIQAHYDGWATSARDATILSAPSTTPARARSCGSAITGPGFRSHPDLRPQRPRGIHPPRARVG